MEKNTRIIIERVDNGYIVSPFSTSMNTKVFNRIKELNDFLSEHFEDVPIDEGRITEDFIVDVISRAISTNKFGLRAIVRGVK